MWRWGRSFCSPLWVTSGAGGVCTQVAAGGWELRGVSGLSSEHILLLRPAYLQSLDSLRRRCEEEVKWLGPGRWGRANGLKKTDQAGAEDAAVALAAATPIAQVWAATGRSPNQGSTIALILFYRLACTCMFDRGEDEGGKRRCEYCSSSSRQCLLSRDAAGSEQKIAEDVPRWVARMLARGRTLGKPCFLVGMWWQFWSCAHSAENLPCLYEELNLIHYAGVLNYL